MPLNTLTVIQGSLENAPEAVTAWVDSNAIEIRQGPGIYDGVVGTLAINSLILVLGLDETQSWALVEPLLGDGSGWAPIQFLTFSEPVTAIPPAPALPPPARPNSAGRQRGFRIGSAATSGIWRFPSAPRWIRYERRTSD